MIRGNAWDVIAPWLDGHHFIRGESTLMDTRHLLDISAQAFVSRFPSYDPSRQTLGDYRQDVVATYSRRAPPKPLNFEERKIPGRVGAPDVRVLLYRPAAAMSSMPAIIHFHGGGFFSGTAEMVASESRAISDEHAALVLAVDYRLAPETPFPGPSRIATRLWTGFSSMLRQLA